MANTKKSKEVIKNLKYIFRYENNNCIAFLFIVYPPYIAYAPPILVFKFSYICIEHLLHFFG
jgi:hypothetical protein